MLDWKDKLTAVYSTDKDVQYEIEHPKEPVIETLPPSRQNLRIASDKRNRKGKQVTIIADFKGRDEDLDNLARELKKRLGVGGSVKDGEIIIQGNFKNQVHSILTGLGYKSRLI